MTTTEIRFFRVGGCVRDGLLGIPTKDIDFAVEAPSFESMAEAVLARCTKVFTDNDGKFIGQDFFTIRGIEPELGAVDFTLCRKDGPSTDGRHPDFVLIGDIFTDLARRDFTVNAMAIDDNNILFDPHGGQKDLEDRRLRFVGKPEDRLQEDALRAFRALRFAITKGFSLTEDTIIALATMEPEDFDAVSTERIREELFKMFAKNTKASLRTLLQFPVMLQLAFDRGLWLEPTTRQANSVNSPSAGSLPILPYSDPVPNSGHSGSDTSKDRALARDRDGRTRQAQIKILSLVTARGREGLTVAEARDALPDMHHGTISGTLSTLHQGGRLARLTNVRGGCKIYVLPSNTAGRSTERQGWRQEKKAP